MRGSQHFLITLENPSFPISETLLLRPRFGRNSKLAREAIF